MKKSFLLALVGALMMFAIPACSNDSPLPGNDIPDAGNEELPPELTYSIINMGAGSISLGHDESTDIRLMVKDSDNALRANANIVLSLSMNQSNAASFASASSKTSAIITTGSDGIATATLYSSTKNATGKIVASLPDRDANSVEITVVINKESGNEGTTGSVNVAITNSTSAMEADLYIKEIENSSYTSGICESFNNGNTIPEHTNAVHLRSLGTNASHTFRDIAVGKKVAVYAYGSDSTGNRVAKGCTESTGTVSASSPLSVTLDLEEEAIIYDEIYNVLLHLNLSQIIPDEYQRWFELVEGLFRSPLGTAAWYLGGFIPSTSFSLLGQTIAIGPGLIRGNATSLIDALDQCDAGSCPAIYTGSVIDSLLSNFSLFGIIIEQGESALNTNVPYYQNIKEVGQDIVKMAKSFDIGSQFKLEEQSDGSLKIYERWTHVIWTWTLGENCTAQQPTCGRYAFRMANGFRADAVVDLTYSGTITKYSDYSKIDLSGSHSFPLNYGSLITMLINRVVVPNVLGTEGDLGDLLDSWINCNKVATSVYDWLDGLDNIVVNLALAVLNVQTLTGYCQQGLSAAANAALNPLENLSVDANLTVPAGSSFQLKNLNSNRIYENLTNLDYRVQWNGQTTQVGAGLTGAGSIAPSTFSCAFMNVDSANCNN